MKEKWSSLVRDNTRYLLNLSTTYISQLISAITVLVITPILLTRLGNAGFSMYGMVLNAVYLAGIFDFGLNLGLLKKLVGVKTDQSILISTVFFFFIVLGMIALPIGFFCSHYFLGEQGWYGFITIVLIAQTIVILFFDVMLQSVNKIYLGRIIRITKLLVEFVILLFLSRYNEVKLLLIASVLLNLLFIAALIFFAKKEVVFTLSVRSVNWAILWQHFRYSWWYFINSVTVVLVFNAQLMMMGWVATADQIAKFLIASRFFDIIRIGISNFTLILFPTLASLQQEGDWHKIQRLFKKIWVRVTVLALVVLLLAAIVVKPFFLVWSKFNDVEMTQVYLLYCCFIFLILVDNVSATFLSALKENSQSVAVSFFQGLIGLVLGYFLLQQVGLIGLLAGSIAALVLTNLWINPYILLRKIKNQIVA